MSRTILSLFLCGTMLFAAPSSAEARMSQNLEKANPLTRAAISWASGKHADAVRIWQGLALEDNGTAWYNLGQAYRLGRGITANLNAAIAAYKLADRFGEKRAHEQLGFVLYSVPERKAEGLALLVQAADGGSARASYVVAMAELAGEGLARDKPRALEHLLTAAKGGINDAWGPLMILRSELLDVMAPLPPTPSSAQAPDAKRSALAVIQSWKPRPSETAPTDKPGNSDLMKALPKPTFGPAAPTAPSSIALRADTALTLDQIAVQLSQLSGRRIDFSLDAADEYKRSDLTHRLRFNWNGPVEGFARQIASAFKIAVNFDEQRITFTSLKPSSGGQALAPVSSQKAAL